MPTRFTARKLPRADGLAGMPKKQGRIEEPTAGFAPAFSDLRDRRLAVVEPRRLLRKGVRGELNPPPRLSQSRVPAVTPQTPSARGCGQRKGRESNPQEHYCSTGFQPVPVAIREAPPFQ